MKCSSRPQRYLFKLIACLSFLSLSFGFLLVTTHSVSASETGSKATTTKTNWPMSGFDAQHTNFNPNETTITTKNVSRLVPAWHQPGSYTVVASPVVANGIAYIVTNNMLYAFNAITGKSLWSAVLPFPTLNVAPVVAGGFVYVSSNEGLSTTSPYLISYNAQTGKIAWANQNGGSGYPMTYANGNLYIGNNGSLTAVKAATGQLLWSRRTSLNEYWSTSPAVANGIVYDPAGNNLSTFDATTGKPLWSVNTGTTCVSADLNYIQVSPSVANGIVYFGTCNDTVYALNAQTGKIIWKALTGNYSTYTTPAVANGIVYIDAGNILALDAKTGKKLWSVPAGIPIFPTTSGIAVANGILYAGEFSSNPYKGTDVFAFNATTGAQLWIYDANIGAITYTPVVVNGMLYIGINNEIYAFHLS